MKKILLDFISLQANTIGDFNGGGEYAKIIFDKLLENSDDIFFYGLISSEFPLNEFVNHFKNKFGLTLFDKQKVTLNNIINQNNIDTIYSPLPYGFSNLGLKNTRFIGTIHGLRDLELIDPRAQLYYCKNYLEKLKVYFKIIFPNIKLNKSIYYYKKLINQKGFEFITVSNHSKYSIISYLNPEKSDKIKVFYSPNTTNSKIKKFNSIKKYFHSLNSNKYFLLVSGNRWMKNNARAIFAFDELFNSNDLDGFKVVLTGVKEELPFFKNIKNKENFLFLDYVSRNHLSHLYKHCYSFIYPSLNEGFGYPPIEAMYFGKPVLASPLTSISEVCGEAAIYFNPLSINEIKNRILMVLDKDIYIEKAKKSIAQYKVIKNKQIKDLEKLVLFITS